MYDRAVILTLYRRHLKVCSKASDRFYKRCTCPMWVEGTTNETYVRRSLKTGSWERAQALARVIEEADDPASTPERKDEPVSVVQAVTEYLADAKARELSEATIYKLDIFFRKQFLTCSHPSPHGTDSRTRATEALLELKLDALGEDEIDQPLPVLANIARNALGQFGKLLALGLRDIEDIGRTEPDQHGLILAADVLLGLGILLALHANHRSENADAFLALSSPCGQAGSTRRVQQRGLRPASARTIQELEAEIAELALLEEQALQLRNSDQDLKTRLRRFGSVSAISPSVEVR